MITLHLKVASSLRDTLCESLGNASADSSTIAELRESGSLAIEMETGSTPADLLRALGLPEAQRLMIIVGGKMVTRPEYDTHELLDGAKVSLNPPIQAG